MSRIRHVLTLIAFACLFTAPMASCQTLPTSTPQTQQAGLIAARSLYMAELAYSGWTTSAEAALASGALTAAQRQQVRDIDTRAYAALTLARQGRATAESVLTTIAEAQGLVAVFSSHH